MEPEDPADFQLTASQLPFLEQNNILHEDIRLIDCIGRIYFGHASNTFELLTLLSPEQRTELAALPILEGIAKLDQILAPPQPSVALPALAIAATALASIIKTKRKDSHESNSRSKAHSKRTI